MKIAEIVDPRIFSSSIISKDYYFLQAIINSKLIRLLVWPGDEIRLRRIISKKQLSGLKIKSIKQDQKINNSILCKKLDQGWHWGWDLFLIKEKDHLCLK